MGAAARGRVRWDGLKCRSRRSRKHCSPKTEPSGARAKQRSRSGRNERSGEQLKHQSPEASGEGAGRNACRWRRRLSLAGGGWELYVAHHCFRGDPVTRQWGNVKLLESPAFTGDLAYSPLGGDHRNTLRWLGGEADHKKEPPGGSHGGFFLMISKAKPYRILTIELLS